jgi:hypothetical protein
MNRVVGFLFTLLTCCKAHYASRARRGVPPLFGELALFREPLGAGGMGEVYRARDPRLSRDAAVKLITTDATPSPDRLRHFETEARAAASLAHPNVVTVHDVGTHEGYPYLVLELLEDETLRETLRRGLPPAARRRQLGPRGLPRPRQAARTGLPGTDRATGTPPPRPAPPTSWAPPVTGRDRRRPQRRLQASARACEGGGRAGAAGDGGELGPDAGSTGGACARGPSAARGRLSCGAGGRRAP